MLKLFRSTGLMFLLTAFSLSVSLAEDEITISTYYPSPHGVYNKLQTDKLGIGDNDGDGNLTSADTPDETGNVWIAGKVGIGTGTTTPASKLSVAGGIQLGDDAEGCTSAKAGTQRWHNGAMEVCNGSDWKAVGGGGEIGIFKETSGYETGIGIQTYCINKGYLRAIILRDMCHGCYGVGTPECNGESKPWDRTSLELGAVDTLVRAGVYNANIAYGGYCRRSGACYSDVSGSFEVICMK